MAFKKTMAQRLLSISRCANPIPAAPSLRQSFIHSDPGDTRRIRPPPQLIQKLPGLDIARDRIRLDGLIPPDEKHLTAKDVSKLMRAAQLEMVKAHVRSRGRHNNSNNWVSYSEFVEMCREGCGGNKERGAAMAKLLDDSGAVIVLAHIVCLHPHQVVGAVQGLINPLPVDPRRRRELEEMEKEKAEIDRAAEWVVRRELWAGLACLVVQTAAFVRLTFWELSWDVMEPICFYVTSAYFMAGYAFFLRTSMEPSFEGFFRARFAAKQKRLFATRGFDINKYNDLKKACNSQTTSS